jgi:hypothetical protein
MKQLQKYYRGYYKCLQLTTYGTVCVIYGNFEVKAISRYGFLFLAYGSQRNIRFVPGQLIFKQF